MGKGEVISSRLSPLDAEHRRLGAKLVDFGGWQMPIAYPSGTIAEHLACRNGAVVFDVSHLGTVRVTGPEAYERLQYSLTNDLGRISPGHAQYTHLLDDNGSVLDDIIVWWFETDCFDVMPNAANTSSVLAAIGGTDVTASRAILAIQGPLARAKMASVFEAASTIARFAVGQSEWRGHLIRFAGTGYTGEDGLECAVPLDAAAAFWEELLDAGVVPAGLGARDTLRLEAGLPLHGHELGPGVTPLQAGLGWVVAWDKADFRGKKALLVERESGAQRRLRGFATEGRQPPRADSTIFSCEQQASQQSSIGNKQSRRDSEQIGVITSGNFSPILGRGIAMGFVPPEVKPGARVEIDIRGRRAPAQVVRLPFIRK